MMPYAEAQQLHPPQHQPSFVPDWVKDAIFYQIFPERFANGDKSNDPVGTEPWGGVPKGKNYFGGDLQGIIQHLDYIKDLGVNTLYLNPIFASNSNHKYHTSDYMQIDTAFGDHQTFVRLVEECHKRGLRIILDGVFNHTGVEFFAFKDIKENEAKSKYLGWYNVYGFPVGPVNKPNYECWWGLGDLPKLMTHNPEVRQHLFAVTRHYMEAGIDGWRLDVPNEVPHHFWVEWRKLVKSINPDAYIVGEIWEDPTPWLKGDQFDAVMNYRFREACLSFFVNGRIGVAQFDSALTSLRNSCPPDVNYVMQNLLGSHDTERLLTLADDDESVMKLAWLFQMTYLGAPMVYYGDEVGMKGGKDPACRGTMVWEKKKQNQKLLATMKSLTRMRNEHAALRRGSYRTLLINDAEKTFAFERALGDERVIVLMNADKKQHTIALALPDSLSSWVQVWPAATKAKALQAPALTIALPAQEGMVFVGGKKP